MLGPTKKFGPKNIEGLTKFWSKKTFIENNSILLELRKN